MNLLINSLIALNSQFNAQFYDEFNDVFNDRMIELHTKIIDW